MVLQVVECIGRECQLIAGGRLLAAEFTVGCELVGGVVGFGGGWCGATSGESTLYPTLQSCEQAKQCWVRRLQG